MRSSLFTVVCCVATVTFADVPPREGANHHLGDDSFVARFSRQPSPVDDEHLRMAVHLRYVRQWLGSRPATQPELASRRAQLLGFLDEYIAAEVTPRNTYVPWRSPVFIDADGRICAVGFLIERSQGRALPERIAATHRLDFLEDIAAAMPEVASWAATSGFTLEELASIQPGYGGPDAQNFIGWLADDFAKVTDGPYHDETQALVITGEFKDHHMTGPWALSTKGGKLVGSGTFARGAGFWASLRLDGSKLAEGAFVRDHAEGEWRFYHPSGRLSAIGRMKSGQREGRWTFFYDSAERRPISTGRFDHGMVVDVWQHFDEQGSLVATSSGRPWVTGLTLKIVTHDGVRREIVQGEPASDRAVEGIFKGDDLLYVRNNGAWLVDAHGNQLARRDDGKWQATSQCWGPAHLKAAARGDVLGLFELRKSDEVENCNAKPVELEPKLAARYEALLAARQLVHTKVPRLLFDDVGRAVEVPDATEASNTPSEVEPQPVEPPNQDDLANSLAANMKWYMEWPHVDGQFTAVFATLPGYTKSSWP